MTRYFRVFNFAQVDGDSARNAEQKFKDKLKDHNLVAEAESFVKGYTSNERLPVRVRTVSVRRTRYRGGFCDCPI